MSWHKNTSQGMFLGVCAGLAQTWRYDVGTVRKVFIIATLFFPVTCFIYGLLAFILPDKSLSSTYTQQLAAVDEQLQQIEKSVTLLEDYVTSDRFELQRKLWTLK